MALPVFCLYALGWRIPMSVFPAGCRRTKKSLPSREGTEKVGTFQHFLSRGKNQELAKSKTVDLASFHFVQSISSRYRNLGRIRAQWQYSRYNKESPFSSNAVSA